MKEFKDNPFIIESLERRQMMDGDNPHDVQDLVHLPDLGTGGAQGVLQRLDDGALVELRLFLVLCGHWTVG